MKNVLITGATGFIGSKVCTQLICAGHEITMVGRSKDRLSKLKSIVCHKFPNADCTSLTLDLSKPLNSKSLRKLEPLSFTHLIHCASPVPGANSGLVSDSPEIETQSSEISKNLFHLCRSNHQLKHLVLISSTSVYALENVSPVFENATTTSEENLYGFSKLQTEFDFAKLAKEKSCLLTILRPCQVYGPGEPHGLGMTKMLRGGLKHGTISLHNGGIDERDFVFVDDLAKFVLASIKNGSSGIFNVGPTKASSMLEVAELIKENCDNPVRIDIDPATQTNQTSKVSNQKLCKEFPDINFTTLSDGIRACINWEKKAIRLLEVREQRKRAQSYLVNGKDIRNSGFPAIDFQMHTTWTDGKSRVEEMIRAAENQSLKAIAITEHINRKSDYYVKFRNEVEQLRKKANATEVFYGIEVAIEDYEGNLKTHLETKTEAEWVLGVVHSYPDPTGGYFKFEDLTREFALECELKGLLCLASNSAIDAIGHPGGTFFKKFGPFPVELMEPIFNTAKKHEIAIEFNTKYMWDIEGMLNLLARTNPLVCFGSDAHQANDVGMNYVQMKTWFQGK